jgi:hypothetical protein
VNELVESLLYEGYALYPYTPGATKNATPTPFGIVYPPAYARQLDSTYDHLDLQCVVEGDDPRLTAEVHFLLPSGERHVAEAQRIEGEGEFEIGGISVRTRLKGSDPLSRMDSSLVRTRTAPSSNSPSPSIRCGSAWWRSPLGSRKRSSAVISPSPSTMHRSSRWSCVESSAAAYEGG